MHCLVLDSYVKTLSTVENFEEDLMKHAVPGEECLRSCDEEKETMKVCYFKFVLEYYQVLGG